MEEEQTISRNFSAEEMPLMRDALMDFAHEVDINPVPAGAIRVKLHVDATDEAGALTGTYEDEYDLSTQALARFIRTNLLATADTITDITTTTHAIAANTAVTAPLVVAGTSTTAAATMDYKLGSISSGGSGSITATVNAFTTSSATSGNFTVTGTITNTSGGTLNYAEVGIQVTAGGNSFLLSHDVFTALGVSNNGTLAVTYTLTFT